MPEYEDSFERVRILESKYNIMRERLLLINQNMIDEYKKLNEDIKIIEDELKELKKDSLKVLEKYINMWNPLNFVTEEDVLNIIKQSKKRGIKNHRRKK